MVDSPFIVPVVACICVAFSVVGLPIARAFARRMERPEPRTLPPELSSRLEHMEQAIDSIAVEVERIAEGQRFTTKLLAERNSSAASGVPERRS